MMLLEVNVLVAMHVRAHVHHQTVRAWFDGRRAAAEPFGVPTSVWHCFVRLITTRAVMDPPASIDEAFAFITAVRGQALHRTLEPGPRHLELLRETCIESRASARLVPDAALAAIAIENGATLASFDRDFARFPKLRWVVPGA